jgi:5-aminopentanamidase
MKVAAYQAPLLGAGSMEAVDLIRAAVKACERAGVEILCCPEAILGGLADYAIDPFDFAIDVESGELDETLRPLSSACVTTIVGFTERSRSGRLFNSAAIFSGARVVGLYRKLHPAINRSVYEGGDRMPVFTINGLTFGIIICLDSTYVEPARTMASRGAEALFVLSNNGLPRHRATPELVADARGVDIARALEHGVFVIRADVAGDNSALASFGSSGIVSPHGTVLAAAEPSMTGLVIADIAPARALCHAIL